MKKNQLFITLIVLLIVFAPAIVLADTTCPLGEDVTKDLSGALKIARIVAPLLVIGLTFKEGITALVKGDAEGQTKKVVGKLLKRLLAAVLLFAIPVIVDAFMQLLNVWDDTGSCKLDGTTYSNNVDANNTTGKTETCEQRCGHIGDSNGRSACLKNCTTTTTQATAPTNAVVIN